MESAHVLPVNSIRRRLVLLLASLPFGLGVRPAAAEGMKEGVDYRLVSPALPPESSTRVEVIEFFSYACPGCNAFEPSLEPWVKKLPADVLFHRIPVVYHDSWLAPARLYFALDVLGETRRLDQAVFDAIHKQHADFSNPEPIAKFLEGHGIPQKNFNDAFNSCSVETKMQRSKSLLAAYKIDQVPEIAVDGRYVVNPAEGRRQDDVLPVADYLIAEARKQRKLPKQ